MNFNKLTKLQLNLLRTNFLNNKPVYLAASNLHSLVNSVNTCSNSISNQVNREREQFLSRINLRNELGQVQRRFKNKKGGKGKQSQQGDDSDSDEDDDASDDDESSSEEEVDEKSKIIKIETINTRLDMVLKNALKIPKHKVETQINEDRCRVNNERCMKKSLNVENGDIVDMIVGYVDNDPERLTIHRCEFLDIEDKLNARGKILSKVKVTKHLEVENYPNARFEYF